MLKLVGQGFEARLHALRRVTGLDRDLHLQGPGAEDRGRLAQWMASDMDALLPLSDAVLSEAFHARPTHVLARILGRDYPRNGPAAMAAIRSVARILGSGSGHGEAAWLRVGQSVLDVSLGLPLHEETWGVPPLPTVGLDGAAFQPMDLGACLLDLMRPVAMDAAGLLVAMGVTDEDAEMVQAGDDGPGTLGAFVCGLVEGMADTSWTRLASRAVEAGPYSDVRAIPLAVAGHLVVQSASGTQGFTLPGVGHVFPKAWAPLD